MKKPLLRRKPLYERLMDEAQWHRWMFREEEAMKVMVVVIQVYVEEDDVKKNKSTNKANS